MNVIAAGKRYHFVGIGGAGMSGLASVMLAGGGSVSGSDLHANDETDRLERAGASIHLGHDPQHVDGEVDEVIISSAIGAENVEVREAHRRKVPVIRRLHALASLLSGYTSIGVAGTHGKTTTTAMISTILTRLGKDPSYLVGAHCPGLGGNARLGDGRFFVTEVDESDGLFLSLRPTIGVLNNISRDHLTTYKSLPAIVESFAQYIRQSERSVLAVDDPRVHRLAKRVPNGFTVGIEPGADLRATHIQHHHFHSSFDLVYHGTDLGSVFLPAPGAHNVRNALCAIGSAHMAGIPLLEAASALSDFRLPHRRFELLEENGVTVVDDYAHLPEEIEVTLQAIRSGWEERRIVAVFQPHRYTRTQALGDDFGAAFGLADTVIVTPIYPANEPAIPGVSSQAIVRAIARSRGVAPYLIQEKDEAVSFLKGYIEPGDFIISFGAGDIWTVTEELSCFLKEGSFCAV